MPNRGIPRLKGFDYSAERTYFVTFCAKNRQPVFAELQNCVAAKETLLRYRALGWYWLNCYCVMPDHIHLLIRTRNRSHSLSAIVARLKRQIREASCGEPPEWHWQLGFHDRVLREHENVRGYAQYILANPIRRGMAKEVGDYPFCAVVDPWF